MNNFSIDLPFETAPINDAFSPDELTQHYDLRPPTSRQDRFKDRLVVEPRLKITDYRCDAVIDWIELAYVTVDNSHQSTNIHRDLTKQLQAAGQSETFHVTGPQGRESYQGDSFLIRIFDPTPAGVRIIHNRMKRRWNACPNTDDVVGRICGIEVSIDFYPIARPEATVVSDVSTYRTDLGV